MIDFGSVRLFYIKNWNFIVRFWFCSVWFRFGSIILKTKIYIIFWVFFFYFFNGLGFSLVLFFSVFFLYFQFSSVWFFDFRLMKSNRIKYFFKYSNRFFFIVRFFSIIIIYFLFFYSPLSNIVVQICPQVTLVCRCLVMFF